MPKKVHREVTTGLIRNQTSLESKPPESLENTPMVIRFKDTIIDSIEDAETRRLKILKISSRAEGVTLTLELPDALCGTLVVGDNIGIVIDSKPIPTGESSKLYVEGSVFKRLDKDGLEVVGSIGGLRLVLTLAKVTPSQSSTFDSEKFYMTIK
jgi:F0F1-type ATP synthase alpha subunit